MTHSLHFQGFIKGVTYKAHLIEELEKYSIQDFNINTSAPYGLIHSENSEIAYSRWVSPKRTRSYPFARIYNTYNCSKSLTVIPVLKDEGLDGDLDKIQYSTISWMNLLNVYIVLGYYENAVKNNSEKQRDKNKLTAQTFNNDFVKSQIIEILQYKQSALHWNKNLFEDRFTDIFYEALDSYTQISSATNVKIHPQARLERYLNKVVKDFENFKNISLQGSQRATVREAATIHKLEHLEISVKGIFHIRNYLGGTYYITADEVLLKDGTWLIQESKNTAVNSLPDISDIQDGLFKLIIYSNLNSLAIDNNEVSFSSRLKLTGRGIQGSIIFPSSDKELATFYEINQDIFTERQINIINRLRMEATYNQKLGVEIKSNL